MALISEWMEQCGKKVLDNAGIVRDAWLRQQSTVYGGISPDLKLNFPELSFVNPRIELQGEVCMKHLGFWLVFLVPGLLHAQHATSAQQKFISGGTIRLHLESGGYSITPGDSENIVVTCRAHTEEQLKRVKVEIKPTAVSADVYVSETRTTTSRPLSRFLVIPIFGPDCQLENWTLKV